MKTFAEWLELKEDYYQIDRTGGLDLLGKTKTFYTSVINQPENIDDETYDNLIIKFNKLIPEIMKNTQTLPDNQKASINRMFQSMKTKMSSLGKNLGRLVHMQKNQFFADKGTKVEISPSSNKPKPKPKPKLSSTSWANWLTRRAA